MNRREFLKSTVAVAASAAIMGGEEAAFGAQSRPNVILINCDDLGYGDLSCYGSEKIATPNLDALARNGMRFTDFHSCSPVCTPSRTGLLTGRYPIRSGMTRVLGPGNQVGIPDNEVILAQVLKKRGYKTAIIGKWHLGHLPQFLPTRHGFDYYYGIPYSNNMGEWTDGRPNCPLMRNEEIIERPAVQETLTERYTDETISYIKANKDKPFFVYLAHNMPHNPVSASERFKGKSKGGLYGDAVECIDWGVGQIVNALKELGLDKKTLVMFTSDNGPNAGSAGILRGGKTQVFEGGMREPFIASWPGTIKPRTVCRQPSSMLDLFTTVIRLAGGEPPKDRPIDGRDISKLFKTPGARLPDYPFYYFRTEALQAVRCGPWKLHLGRDTEALAEPELYNLDLDVREARDVAKDHPDLVASLTKRAEEFVKDLPNGAHIGGSAFKF